MSSQNIYTWKQYGGNSDLRMRFSAVKSGKPCPNWLNDNEILSRQLRVSKESLETLWWERVWPSTQAARPPTQWPIDFWWSQTASKRPPGLCASSFVLIYPRSPVDISRNHPEGLSMLACMTIGWADTDQFSWSHRFWPLSWKQNTFSYYTTL